MRLDVRKIENLKDGTEVVGSRTRVKVVKNKVAPPFRQCEFDIMYGKGISKEGSLIDVGVDLEIVKKAGAWFTYEGDQLGQGRENARQFLAEHVDIRDEIERKVREAVGLTAFGAEGDETPIEVVPDLVLEDCAEPVAAAPPRPKARKATDSAVSRSGFTGAEAPEELSRARPRSPRGARSEPPRARAAAARRRVSRPRGRTSPRAARARRARRRRAFARQVAEHGFGVKRSGGGPLPASLPRRGSRARSMAERWTPQTGTRRRGAGALAAIRAARMGGCEPAEGVPAPLIACWFGGATSPIARRAARKALGSTEEDRRIPALPRATRP